MSPLSKHNDHYSVIGLKRKERKIDPIYYKGDSKDIQDTLIRTMVSEGMSSFLIFYIYLESHIHATMIIIFEIIFILFT